MINFRLVCRTTKNSRGMSVSIKLSFRILNYKILKRNVGLGKIIDRFVSRTTKNSRGMWVLIKLSLDIYLERPIQHAMQDLINLWHANLDDKNCKGNDKVYKCVVEHLLPLTIFCPHLMFKIRAQGKKGSFIDPKPWTYPLIYEKFLKSN